MNKYDPNMFEREKKSPIKIAIIGILAVSIILGSIFILPQFITFDEETLEETQVKNALSTTISPKTPTLQIENVPSDALLDETISENREFTLNLEAGRYLISFSPDARVKVYQEGRDLYAKVKETTAGDYLFDINNGESNNIIVSVQTESQTKIMLVQRARFK